MDGCARPKVSLTPLKNTHAHTAHGARARFIRLSEAAEQLRLRAAMDVKAGMDENAVRLLQEKQRVMEALELSKKRASVLDELYAKLNEVSREILPGHPPAGRIG